MLRTILRLAAKSGTIRCEELARALDISPELVQLALAELVRRDYLQALVPGCSAPCEHCPLCAVCLNRGRKRVWMLTGKGAAWLAEDPILG